VSKCSLQYLEMHMIHNSMKDLSSCNSSAKKRLDKVRKQLAMPTFLKTFQKWQTYVRIVILTCQHKCQYFICFWYLYYARNFVHFRWKTCKNSRLLLLLLFLFLFHSLPRFFFFCESQRNKSDKMNATLQQDEDAGREEGYYCCSVW